MAKINATWKRRIRIEGKPDETRGYMLLVCDAETGEMINNVRSVVVRLAPEADNEADVTYHEVDEAGHFMAEKDGKSVERTITVKDPEIAVTAFETNEYADGQS